MPILARRRQLPSSAGDSGPHTRSKSHGFPAFLLLLLLSTAAEAHSKAFGIAVTLLLPLQFACLALHVMAHMVLPQACVPFRSIENFLCSVSGLAWMLGGMGPIFALFFTDALDAQTRFDFGMLGIASTLTLYGHWMLVNEKRAQLYRKVVFPLMAALASSACIGASLV